MATPNYDELIERLRGEFVDEAEDQFNSIDILLENLRSGSTDEAEALVKIRRVAHSLKGSAGAVDFPLVALIMHRMEDYLGDAESLNEQQLADIQVYVDKAREYSSLDVNQESIQADSLVRMLPAQRAEGAVDGADEAIPTDQIIEVMMVIKEKKAGMLFERELRAAGLRVTTVRNSFSALEMAVRTKPNLVIVSGVLDELSGIDVVSALHAMPKTKDTPVCLLTSFDNDHPELQGLSDTIVIIHKNHFHQDLDDILARFSLV